MTLDIPQFIANAIRTQSKIQHLDINVKTVPVDMIPSSVSSLITKDYGKKYLLDADFVSFFWGDIDKDKIEKLFNVVDKALGKSANKLTNTDFKKLAYGAGADESVKDEPDEETEQAEDTETEDSDASDESFEPADDSDDKEIEVDAEVEADADEPDAETDEESSEESSEDREDEDEVDSEQLNEDDEPSEDDEGEDDEDDEDDKDNEDEDGEDEPEIPSNPSYFFLKITIK